MRRFAVVALVVVGLGGCQKAQPTAAPVSQPVQPQPVVKDEVKPPVVKTDDIVKTSAPEEKPKVEEKPKPKLKPKVEAPVKATGPAVKSFSMLEFKDLITGNIIDVEKLVGKRIEVSGTVYRIDKNSRNPNRRNLVLQDDSSQFDIWFSDGVFIFDGTESLAKLQKGDKVTILGQVYFNPRETKPYVIYCELK